jgi:hypothetical protein
LGGPGEVLKEKDVQGGDTIDKQELQQCKDVGELWDATADGKRYSRGFN